MHDYMLVDFDAYFCKDVDATHTDDFIMGQFSKRIPDDEAGYTRFMERTDLLMKLGNCDVTQGLELAIRFLPLGECAIVKCHSKFSHPNGRKNSCIEDGSHDAPPGVDVIYRVYLRSIKSLGHAQSNSFRFKLAKQLKYTGNDYYKYEWTAPNGGFGKVMSLKAYNDAKEELISLLKDIAEMEMGEGEGASEDEVKMKSETMTLLVDCFNNIAAVHLQGKEYSKAKEAAGEAISLDPDNVKALCRAVKASMLSGAFDESKMALYAAIELDENNKEVQKVKAEFERRLIAYQKKEKSMYERMMKGGVDTGTGADKDLKAAKSLGGQPSEKESIMEGVIGAPLEASSKEDEKESSTRTCGKDKISNTTNQEPSTEIKPIRTKEGEQRAKSWYLFTAAGLIALLALLFVVASLKSGNKPNPINSDL